MHPPLLNGSQQDMSSSTNGEMNATEESRKSSPVVTPCPTYSYFGIDDDGAEELIKSVTRMSVKQEELAGETDDTNIGHEDPLNEACAIIEDHKVAPSLAGDNQDVEQLVKTVAQISIQNEKEEAEEYQTLVEKNHSTSKAAAATETKAPPSLTFWGVNEDVEQLIPVESFKLIFGQQDHEASSLEDKIAAKKDSTSEAGVSHKEPVVSEEVKVPPTLRVLASWIQSGACGRILVVSGAGVSVAAGIPDFRTKGTGLYDNLQKYNLPFPEAIFDLGFYSSNPNPFISLAREIWPGSKYAPTLTHTFITLLAKKGLLLRNYSQNIDGLEYLANLPAEYLVECHGHFRSASCIRCRSPADIDKVRDSIVLHGKVAVCSNCGGHVKPDIVFFGEELPRRFYTLLKDDTQQADLVLVLGTSLQVAPVSLIPEMVSDNCKRALINRNLVGTFRLTCEEDGGKEDDLAAGRDVFIAGECDDCILQLARILDWHDELEIMHSEARIFFKNKQKDLVSS